MPKILKEEEEEKVKFKRVLEDKRKRKKSDTQRDTLKKDIIVKNGIINILQKNLEKSKLKYVSLLYQHKKSYWTKTINSLYHE